MTNFPTKTQWDLMLREERINVLKAWHGLTGAKADAWDAFWTKYTAPLEYCPYGKCGGVGFYKLDVPMGHQMFGQAIVCQCKQERDATLNAVRIEKMRDQLSDTEKRWTLENWRGADDNALLKAKHAIRSGYGIYVFWSKNKGTGKSGLLAAIANSALDQKMPTRFITVPDLLDELRGGYRSRDYDQKLEEFKRVKVLALDELGFYYERTNKVADSDDEIASWVDEKMFQILDYRYRNYETLLTVCATNIKPDKGDNSRLASRLSDTERAVIVEVLGADLRPMAKQFAKAGAR